MAAVTATERITVRRSGKSGTARSAMGSGSPMTDTHTHILPEMDDGAPDVNTALRMLRMEREQGEPSLR